MKSSYDVIVVIGGTAGVVAAIQAGRAGAELLFHAMPAAATFADGQWQLTVC
jgi:thioredoxin reductase